MIGRPGKVRADVHQQAVVEIQVVGATQQIIQCPQHLLHASHLLIVVIAVCVRNDPAPDAAPLFDYVRPRPSPRGYSTPSQHPPRSSWPNSGWPGDVAGQVGDGVRQRRHRIGAHQRLSHQFEALRALRRHGGLLVARQAGGHGLLQTAPHLRAVNVVTGHGGQKGVGDSTAQLRHADDIRGVV